MLSGREDDTSRQKAVAVIKKLIIVVVVSLPFGYCTVNFSINEYRGLYSP